MKYLLLSVLFLSVYVHCHAQCEANEIEVFIEVTVDNWGYETYWELNEGDEGCGETPLFIGSNLDVGCDGSGLPDPPPGGYDSNSQYLEGPFCLIVDSVYDIIFVDDYGDGGLIFEVIQDGLSTNYYVGTNEGNTFSFTAGDLTPAFIDGDRPCESLSIDVDGDNLILDNSEATVNAGEIVPEGSFCGLYGAWCDSNGGASNTMWVSFIAPADGSIEISTCNEGNTFDTALAVYEVGDCDDFSTYSLISSNDDAYGGCGNGSTGFASVCYASCLTPGETYHIQVDGWEGESGVTELSVSSYLEAPEIFSLSRNVQCANVKGETGSLLVPQVVGMGINYDVSWTGPFGFESNDALIQNIPVGDYTCTITDACGYSGSETFSITAPEVVTTSSTVTNSSCPEVNNGTIEIIATGGEAPYEFSWSGPDGYIGLGNSISELINGTYLLEIIDDNDCEYTSTVTVDTDNILEFSLGEDETVCLNEYALFEGPEGFFNYDWQDGSDGSSFIFPAWQSGVGEHSVTLTVSNELGCVYTDVANITVDNCTGIEELEDSHWNLYPNPTVGMLTLEVNANIEKPHFKLIDAQGRMVMSKELTNSETTLDLSPFSSGIYTVKIESSNQLIGQQKLVIE